MQVEAPPWTPKGVPMLCGFPTSVVEGTSEPCQGLYPWIQSSGPQRGSVSQSWLGLTVRHQGTLHSRDPTMGTWHQEPSQNSRALTSFFTAEPSALWLQSGMWAPFGLLLHWFSNTPCSGFRVLSSRLKIPISDSYSSAGLAMGFEMPPSLSQDTRFQCTHRSWEPPGPFTWLV